MLFRSEYSGPVQSEQRLVPGIFFSSDPEVSNTIHVESRPGELMTFRFDVDQPGRWLSLSMAVGSADFSGCKIAGFACKLDAPATSIFRACLRSGEEGGPRDVFFPKSVVAYPKTALHLDVLEFDTHPNIRLQAPWREFVIFFPVESAEINLRDLRFFVI